MRSRRGMLVSVGVASLVTLTFPLAATGADEQNSHIYVMDADGANTTRLTSNRGANAQPSWSPDGTKIAFTDYLDGPAIYVMGSDGSNVTRLTSGAAWDVEPNWSPDGTKIAFASGRDGDMEIYVMNADGANPTRLTDSPGWDEMPRWSPDGTQIAFASGRLNDIGDIFVMNADGTNPTRLTDDPTSNFAPTWSPDGTQIAFVSDRGLHWDIWAMDADGSNPVNLTNDQAQDEEPSWSPDGTKIAYTTIRGGGGFEIFAMDADGSNKTNLTNNPAEDRWASWSPDSTKITFSSFPWESQPRLTVEPYQVQAGDPVAVSGARCPSSPVEVQVSQPSSDVPVVEAMVEGDSEGNWSVVIDTRGLEPGLYEVRSSCFPADGRSFDYRAVNIRVNEGAVSPAEPAPGEPNFAG